MKTHIFALELLLLCIHYGAATAQEIVRDAQDRLVSVKTHVFTRTGRTIVIGSPDRSPASGPVGF
jgi:hypothetical protein